MLKRILLIIVAIFVAFVGAAFSVRNGHMVDFNYYLGQINLPLSVIMVVTLAIGVLLGILSTLGMLIKLKFKSASYAKKCERLENDCQEKINLVRVKQEEIKELRAKVEKNTALEHNPA